MTSLLVPFLTTLLLTTKGALPSKPAVDEILQTMPKWERLDESGIGLHIINQEMFPRKWKKNNSGLCTDRHFLLNKILLRPRFSIRRNLCKMPKRQQKEIKESKGNGLNSKFWIVHNPEIILWRLLKQPLAFSDTKRVLHNLAAICFNEEQKMPFVCWKELFLFLFVVFLFLFLFCFLFFLLSAIILCYSAGRRIHLSDQRSAQLRLWWEILLTEHERRRWCSGCDAAPVPSKELRNTNRHRRQSKMIKVNYFSVRSIMYE